MFRIKILNLKNLIKLNNELHRKANRKLCSSLPYKLENDDQNSKRIICFDEMIKDRRHEASRSLAIQVNSENSYKELFNYCSQFGSIKSAFHYKISEANNHFILLEFDDVSSCDNALNHASFNEENLGVPVSSRFLWFRALNTRKASVISDKIPPFLKSEDIKLIDEKTLEENLQFVENIDDQILSVYRATCLSDFGTRIRFLICKQLETAFSGIFPFIKAFPFGSSVNGFGKMGCDLDIALNIHKDQGIPSSSDSRLVFHTKVSLANERTQIQRQMETVSDVLHIFLPGIINVRRILQARVPIIKYNHECLDLEVDLSMGSLTGLYMSELLYLYGEMDERVRPLTFCIRKWANTSGLTNPSPGRWISNFSLTILVLFFLQCLKKPILPPLTLLVKSATKEDIRIADGNVNCTFKRDINNLKFQTQNKDSLSHLLSQFFEFYSQFDFSNRAVSLLEGRPMLKADHSAMWIVNPLEPLLNVSKNLSFEELERFKMETRNAAWILESVENKQSDGRPWGLLSILRKPGENIIKPQMFFKSRLVDVTEIFDVKDDNRNQQYLNGSVKQQVDSIRQSTKKKIQKMEKNMKAKRMNVK